MKKNYTRELFKTREEWLAQRGIGGTSASAIVGQNPWLTKLELYNSFVIGAKEKSDSPTLAYGRAMEPLIRKEYKLDHPELIVRDPKGFEMYRSNEEPMLTATVDGFVTERKTGRKGILEIKTHDVKSAADAEDWEDGRIPPNYIFQMLHYLLVLNDCEFARFVGRVRFFDYDNDREITKTVTVYHNIERDDPQVEMTLKYLKEEELRFVDSVKKRIPPDGLITF